MLSYESTIWSSTWKWKRGTKLFQISGVEDLLYRLKPFVLGEESTLTSCNLLDVLIQDGPKRRLPSSAPTQGISCMEAQLTSIYTKES